MQSLHSFATAYCHYIETHYSSYCIVSTIVVVALIINATEQLLGKAPIPIVIYCRLL